MVARFRDRTPIASWRNAGELMVANRTIADLLLTMENDLQSIASNFGVGASASK